MRILRRNKNSLSIFFLLLLSWAVFLLCAYINEEKYNANRKYVPTNATLVLRVDARQLLKTSINQIFIKDKNETIFKTLNTLIKQSSGENKYQDLGIDFLSDIIVSVSPYKQGKIVCIAFNLVSATSFEKNVNKLLKSQQTFQIKEKVGLIYQYVPNDPQINISTPSLKKYVSDEIKFKEYKLLADNPGQFLEIETKRAVFDPTTSIESARFNFSINDNFLEVNGTLDLKEKIKPANYTLQPNGFHLSTFYFPKKIKTSFQQVLKRLDLSLPEIEGFSLNYRSMAFSYIDNEMLLDPDLDILIETKEAFSSEKFIQDKILPNYSKCHYENGKLSIGESTYYIKQIKPTLFFIGKSNRPPLGKNDLNQAFLMKGDLSHLLKIKGGGLVLSLLEMHPMYKSTQSFIGATDQINVQSKKKSDKQLMIKGNLQFKKGHYSASEILLFLLRSELF